MAPPSQKTNILQANLHHSVTATAQLRKWLEVNLTALALIQEPWVRRGRICGLSNTGDKLIHYSGPDSPRARIYISNNLLVQPLTEFCSRDLCAIILLDETTHQPNTVVASAYMPEGDNLPPPELSKLVSHCEGANLEIIVATDCNAHHSLWGMQSENERGNALNFDVKVEPDDTMSVDMVPENFNEFDVHDKNDLDDDINLSMLKEIKPKTVKKIKKERNTVIELKDANKADYRTTDIRNMVKVIITYSTATLFRWSYSKYMCFFCDKVFVKMSQLKQHNFEHLETNLENALKCINTETKVKLEITDFACKTCPNDMQTLDDFLDHVTMTHKQIFNKTVRCSIFAFRITDTEAPCPECHQNFTFFGNLLSHVYKNHLTAGTFLCDTCGKGFLTKFMLKKHIKLTHSNTEYRCQKCSQTFKTHGAYSYHRLLHKGEFPCPQCPEKFPSWYLRKRHIAFFHDKSLQISCELCSKKFVKYNSLKWHLMSVHHNDKPFSCEMCDFKCINKSYLKRHMITHSDTRPFQCHVCVKSFQRKEHLETHVRIHTNDKRFVCKECGKRFVQVTGLKVHLRAHHSKADT